LPLEVCDNVVRGCTLLFEFGERSTKLRLQA